MLVHKGALPPVQQVEVTPWDEGPPANVWLQEGGVHGLRALSHESSFKRSQNSWAVVQPDGYPVLQVLHEDGQSRQRPP